MNKKWKLSITAFLIGCGIILGIIALILSIAWVAVLLNKYMPFITVGIVFFLFAGVLSIPIRDILEQKELSKEYQRKKDEERKRNGWLPN